MNLTPPLPTRPGGKVVEQPRCVSRYPHGPAGDPVRCDRDRDHKVKGHAAVLPPLEGRDEPRIWSWL